MKKFLSIAYDHIQKLTTGNDHNSVQRLVNVLPSLAIWTPTQKPFKEFENYLENVLFFDVKSKANLSNSNFDATITFHEQKKYDHPSRWLRETAVSYSGTNYDIVIKFKSGDVLQISGDDAKKWENIEHTSGIGFKEKKYLGYSPLTNAKVTLNQEVLNEEEIKNLFKEIKFGDIVSEIIESAREKHDVNIEKVVDFESQKTERQIERLQDWKRQREEIIAKQNENLKSVAGNISSKSI